MLPKLLWKGDINNDNVYLLNLVYQANAPKGEKKAHHYGSWRIDMRTHTQTHNCSILSFSYVLCLLHSTQNT